VASRGHKRNNHLERPIAKGLESKGQNTKQKIKKPKATWKGFRRILNFEYQEHELGVEECNWEEQHSNMSLEQQEHNREEQHLNTSLEQQEHD